MVEGATDVNGNPIVFVNPLPESASNPWFSEVKINNVDVAFEEGRLGNDIPVTGFTQGFSDEAFVVQLRRPNFNDNHFIKFNQPTIISEGSTFEVAVDMEKQESYKVYFFRVLIASLTETFVDCPTGFKAMSSKSGILNLGYNYNWDSKYARGCLRKVKVHRKERIRERNRRISMTATTDWVVIFSINGDIKAEYLETTNQNTIVRSGVEPIRYSGRNRINVPFRSHGITQL